MCYPGLPWPWSRKYEASKLPSMFASFLYLKVRVTGSVDDHASWFSECSLDSSHNPLRRGMSWKPYSRISPREMKSCHTVTVIFMHGHAQLFRRRWHARVNFVAINYPINSPNGTHGDVKKNERRLPWHSYGRWCPAIYPCSTTWQRSQCLFSTTLVISGKGWGASATSRKAAEYYQTQIRHT